MSVRGLDARAFAGQQPFIVHYVRDRSMLQYLACTFNELQCSYQECGCPSMLKGIITVDQIQMGKD